MEHTQQEVKAPDSLVDEANDLLDEVTRLKAVNEALLEALKEIEALHDPHSEKPTAYEEPYGETCSCDESNKGDLMWHAQLDGRNFAASIACKAIALAEAQP